MISPGRVLVLLLMLTVSLPAQMVDKTIETFQLRYASYDSATATRVVDLLERESKRFKSFFDIDSLPAGEIIVAPGLTAFNRYFGGDSISWAAAAYFPERNLILLRSPRWAGSLPQFEQDVLHELAHFYFDQRYLDVPAPVWLNEGLAQHLSFTAIGTGDAAYLSSAISSKNIVPLDEINRMVTFHRRRARLAYLQSLTAVRFLESRFFPGKSWADLHEAIAAAGWEAALQMQTGMSMREFEVFWYREIEKRYEWMWILNPETLLMTTLVVVFLITAFVVRLKNRRKLAAWEKTELEKDDDHAE